MNASHSLTAAAETSRAGALVRPRAERFDRLDAWRLAHPQTTLRRAAYVHPLRINIGFVARSEAQELVSAADRVLAAALASGELERWAVQTGTTWIAPAEPQVSASVGLADLLAE